MDNYDEIARGAIKKVLGEEDYKKYCSNITALRDSDAYKCAYEAAKLQAERFNDDLDNSYIKYLESQKQHKDEEELC